jgi:hypothetical protein
VKRLMLGLEISTLRAIIAVCRLTGDSLRNSFENGSADADGRREIFARWQHVRQISVEAGETLDSLHATRGAWSGATKLSRPAGSARRAF